MNVKKRIKESGVYQWQVAEALGVNECTMCRWLRRPENLEKAVIEKIDAAITKIAVQRGGGR